MRRLDVGALLLLLACGPPPHYCAVAIDHTPTLGEPCDDCQADCWGVTDRAPSLACAPVDSKPICVWSAD